MQVKSLRNYRAIARKSALGRSGSDVIRIAVFDENPLFRAGIVQVLNAEPGLEILVASDTFYLGTTPLPDVVILESNIMSKLSLAHSISGLRSSVKILVLAASMDEEQFFAAVAAGVRGYLLKDVNGAELVDAVHALHRGEGYVSPSFAAILLIQPLAKPGKGANAHLLAQLTYREGEILKLLTVGLTNREIGRQMGVTEKAIKCDFTHIFGKLHVRNRVEAAMLLRPDPGPHTRPAVAHRKGHFSAVGGAGAGLPKKKGMVNLHRAETGMVRAAERARTAVHISTAGSVVGVDVVYRAR
jgi:two-component system nitrate/nitrite response regulator NarL